MYAKTTILAALLAFTPLAQAGDGVTQLSRESGLSEHSVRMLLGARTPYAEYRCCYSRKLRQFKEAVGEENYRRLVDGRETLPYERPIAAREAEKNEALDTAQVSAL